MTTINKIIDGEVTLPSSKSISNRVLIIHALSNSFEAINNLSNCDDTRNLYNVLYSDTNKFDIGDAGTAMRFLTAYLSGIIGKWELTGSERMQERPIGELVDTLNKMGAQIEYLDKDGFPPLKIFGSNLTNNKITLKGNISSQFISSILLIAPRFQEGLFIELEGEIMSRSYIEMTLSIMNEYGVNSSFINNSIMVEPGQYTTRTYSIESDWTSASYIYECLALSKGGKIKLNSLKRNSFQGDKNQISLWEKLGVKTFFSKRGMYIEKSDVLLNHLRNDFSNMPDLVQTFATTCCALGITFEFSGVETLKIKETDRIEALITELSKLGYILKYDGTLSWDGSITKTKNDIEIDTYGDHRMAMSFAPFAIANENISIKDIEVVSKSYPDFWNDIENLDLL